MGELYDKSIFNRPDRPDQPAQKPRGGSNLLFTVVVVLAILAFAGFSAWRWWSARQPINVNTASVEQLENIPEVGPAIAKGIVAGRPYAKPEDLKKVKGIGDKTFEKMKAKVRVE
jgi:competence ComEA-like helix-hairpin-helix protein